MSEMNTTPLIDVMLVLLIMFIITIPVQTHAVKLDMPQNQPNPPPVTEQPVIQRVEVTFDGQLLLNGAPTTAADMDGYFRQWAAQGANAPEVHLRPDQYAQYDIVARLLASAQRAGVKKMGFVGNEAYANLSQ
jgi:biopolymer transport protein ExbD